MKKVKHGIICTVLFLLAACSGTAAPTLKEKSVTLEYGQNPYIDIQLESLLENYDDVKEQYQFSLSLFNADEEEIKEDSITEDALLQVGEYMLLINYAEDTEPLQLPVTIKDTVAPEFKDFKEKVSVDYGYDKDLTKLFSAEDLADVAIRIDGEVDTKKAGDYKVTVIAEDASGNQAEKDCTITVKEKPKTSSSSSSNDSVGSSGSSSSSASKPSGNSGSSSGANSTSGGSSGSSSSDGNDHQSCTIHPNSLMGNTNTKFPHNDAGYSEAWEWANKVWNDTNSEWYKYSAFEVGSAFDTCGNYWYTVNFY